MDIIMIVLLLAELFILMRNIASRAELNRLKEEAVVIHVDQRTWVKVCRILCAVAAVAIAALIGLFIMQGETAMLEGGLFSWLALVLAFAFFAIAPYTLHEWVITEKGIFIYNVGQLIPWGQVITTGVQNGKRMKKVVIQIKKEQGEVFKTRYQMIGMKDMEEANRISELIRQFVHALDRKKIYKKTIEERATDLKKRRWF